MAENANHGQEHKNLSTNNDPFIAKILAPNEQILLSTVVYKFNIRSKRQERTLLITSKGIYNVKQDFIGNMLSVFSARFKIRRKIDINKLVGVTISSRSSEFVLHVPSEYDYRYSSPANRDQILKAIFHSYYLNNSTKPLVLFIKEEINLTKYTTTTNDKKTGSIKMPKEDPIPLDENGLKELLEENRQQKAKLKENTKLVFNKTNTSQEVTLEDFEILKVLGRGTFGKVMLVEKKDTKQLYAMKSMRKEELIDKDQIEHIKTEMKILEKNKSPFMVSLEYAFHTPKKIFLVMTFMQGGELFQHLRLNRRFEEERAKFYAAEVVLAFEYLHSIGAIYRDLKPENILMDKDGHIRLTDFGMAKYVKEGELAKSFVGTPDYWAPEIILGEGHGSAVDWWALGIMTFEMIIGLPPFHNKTQNIQQISKDILNREICFGTKVKISQEAKDFISQLLVKDPHKRLGVKGAEEVKSHVWFKGIDWEKLAEKKVYPPFKPMISNEYDVDNFDDEFTREEPCSSFIDNSNMDLIQKHQKEFEDFVYVADHNASK